MDTNTDVSPITSIIDCFSDLEDPRVVGRTSHKLIDIIIIAICAIICGANRFKDIEAFGYAKRDWLETLLELPNGIPSHQTFGRVFSLISAKKFHECFIQWMNWCHIKTQGDIIAIDGKSCRRSHNTRKGIARLHVINAFAASNGMTIGCKKTPDKSNEIKGIPPLLKMLELKGCVVTMDAMGTQKGIANLIRLRGADYVLALKGNQRRLHRKVKNLFKNADTYQYDAMVYRESQSVDADHDRVEKRIYTYLPLMYLFSFKKTWKNLQTFVRVESRIYQNGEEKTATRYYITSLPLKKYQLIMLAIRQHWHVENKLHWCLDVVFREDESRVWRGYAEQNFSILRKMVLNILRKNMTFNAGLQIQRLYAGWNNDYLSKVIGF